MDLGWILMCEWNAFILVNAQIGWGGGLHQCLCFYKFPRKWARCCGYVLSMACVHDGAVHWPSILHVWAGDESSDTNCETRSCYVVGDSLSELQLGLASCWIFWAGSQPRLDSGIFLFTSEVIDLYLQERLRINVSGDSSERVFLPVKLYLSS